MTKITAMDRPKQALVVPTPLYVCICITKSCSYKFKFSDKTQQMKHKVEKTR